MIPSAIDRLRLNILLEDLTDSEFANILPRLREQHYIAGEIIREDESESEGIHLILEGRVKLTRRTKFGDELRLALLHPGDFFGELPLIDGRPNPGRVTAIDDCTTYVLGKRDFDKLLEESHPFALRLLLVTSIRFRSHNNHFIQELEQTTKHLVTDVRRLERIIDASKLINSTLDLGELLKVILDIAVKIVDADSGTVYLVDEKKGELWSKVLEASEPITIRLPLGKGIAGYVAVTGDTLNIPDAYLDARFNPEVDKRTGYHTRTILCMPMRNKDGAIVGVFQLLNKRSGGFNREDENAITALSVHAALAIEKARLYEEERNKIALEKDLSAAHTVQVGLLPKDFPSIEGYDFAARSIPAKSVAGDLFDFLSVGDGDIAISLGDVSGKGMPAALLMANVQATIRAYSKLNPSAKDCVPRANDLLFASTAPEKFVTLFYGVLDNSKDEFRYVNAGHEPPFFFRKGKETATLKAGGIPLAVAEHFPYEEGKVEFKKGDVLVVFSDGIQDASDSEGNRFGAERIEECIRGRIDLSAREILSGVFDEVTKFVSDTPQFDDMTLLVMKRLS